MFVSFTGQEINLSWADYNSTHPTILAESPTDLAMNACYGEKAGGGRGQLRVLFITDRSPAAWFPTRKRPEGLSDPRTARRAHGTATWRATRPALRNAPLGSPYCGSIEDEQQDMRNVKLPSPPHQQRRPR